VIKKEVTAIYFTMFILSFLVPDAIVSTPIKVPYIETVEPINTVSAHAIAGHTASVNKPRDGGSRVGLLSQLQTVRNNSGSTGK